MFLTKKQFLTALGYKQYSSAQRLARRGGVFAPCRLTPDSNSRYHEKQLRLIEAVMAGVMTLKAANAAWNGFRQDIAAREFGDLPNGLQEIKPVFKPSKSASVLMPPPIEEVQIEATEELVAEIFTSMEQRYSTRKSRAKEAV